MRARERSAAAPVATGRMLTRHRHGPTVNEIHDAWANAPKVAQCSPTVRESSDCWANTPTVTKAAQRSFVVASSSVTAQTSSQRDFRARNAKRRSLGAPHVSYVFFGCGGWI